MTITENTSQIVGAGEIASQLVAVASVGADEIAEVAEELEALLVEIKDAADRARAILRAHDERATAIVGGVRDALPSVDSDADDGLWAFMTAATGAMRLHDAMRLISEAFDPDHREVCAR